MVMEDPEGSGSLRDHLAGLGYAVQCASSTREGQKRCLEEKPDLVVMDGLELARALGHGANRLPCLLLTDPGSLEPAREAVRRGELIDYETNPRDLGHVSFLISQVVEVLSLQEERTLLETQLRKAQRAEAAGVVVNGLAHDFANLFTVLSAQARQLISVRREDPEIGEALQAIEKTVNSGTDLTRQLLSFTRSKRVDWRVLDLGAVLGGWQKSLRRILPGDIELSVEIQGQGLFVRAAESLLFQALLNLLLNAERATPRGGRVRIGVGVREQGERASARDPAPGRYAEIWVQDPGEDLAPEEIQHAFQPSSGSPSGENDNALGLFIAQGIVSQCQGFLEVTCAPGQGTTIRACFPLVDPGEPLTREAPLKGAQVLKE